MFAPKKGCLGQSLQRMLGIELAKKCVVDQIFFCIAKISPKNDIKILKFKIELFLEAFSCQIKENVKTCSHFFYLLLQMITTLMWKRDLQRKRRLLIKETSSLLSMGHDDRGWVWFTLDPPLQTMGGPSIMAGSFRVNAFFTSTSWGCYLGSKLKVEYLKVEYCLV